MSLLPHGLAQVAVAAGALLIPWSTHVPGPPLISGAPRPSHRVKYTPLDKEFYLAADQVGYVRPGLKIAIVDITNVAPGKKPVAEITITDSLNQPLDRLGQLTPGPVTPGFVLSGWDADKRQYFAYTTRTRNGVTDPSTDQNGTWKDLELGHSRYTFGTTLPADFDVTKTLTLGVQARRLLPLEVLDGKAYFADNVFRDFRPDGGAAGPVWDAINTQTACNNCHNPLAMHGGTRRSVRLCVLCHQPQHSLSETGESFDLKVMIHRIHSGKNLPSVTGPRSPARRASASRPAPPASAPTCGVRGSTSRRRAAPGATRPWDPSPAPDQRSPRPPSPRGTGRSPSFETALRPTAGFRLAERSIGRRRAPAPGGQHPRGGPKSTARPSPRGGAAASRPSVPFPPSSRR